MRRFWGQRWRDGRVHAGLCQLAVPRRPGQHGRQQRDDLRVGTGQWLQSGGRCGRNDQRHVYTGHKIYPSLDAAATALGWTNPNRTLKTYLVANGVSVRSPAGFPEYFALATGLRRGLRQPKWSGTAINNHVRTGFGLTALP
jgi:hypothetical protein